MISIEDGLCEVYNDKKWSMLCIKMNKNRLFPVKLDEVQVSLSTEENNKEES